MGKGSKGIIAGRSRNIFSNVKPSQVSIYEYIKSFNIGDKAIIFPRSPDIKIHARFKGKVGRIVEKRGRAYVVEIKEGSVSKYLMLHPVDLKRLE
ncbi:MAG: 50S ribosomal protein L21e [Candidatus Micrarchaeota archaeon]|nr:MAG: 50S ribosomal protein L21e [Candidatus Micrarchaeota archaeon]